MKVLASLAALALFAARASAGKVPKTCVLKPLGEGLDDTDQVRICLSSSMFVFERHS